MGTGGRPRSIRDRNCLGDSFRRTPAASVSALRDLCDTIRPPSSAVRCPPSVFSVSSCSNPSVCSVGQRSVLCLLSSDFCALCAFSRRILRPPLSAFQFSAFQFFVLSPQSSVLRRPSPAPSVSALRGLCDTIRLRLHFTPFARCSQSFGADPVVRSQRLRDACVDGRLLARFAPAKEFERCPLH